jgi:hypothetical protein
MTDAISNPFQRAVRTRKPLKVCVTGPAGAGKTLAALTLADAINAAVGGENPLAVIDTENNSASLYSDVFTFDALDLRPPYTSKAYAEAIGAARRAGYKVAVIDSLSHQWDGPGGILQRKAEADMAPKANGWTNWQSFGRENATFYSGLLQSPLHMVCTLRSKMAYEQIIGGDGRKSVQKLGMAPIARDGSEYEFDLVFDLDANHVANVSKDRTRQFDGQSWDLTDTDTARRLLDWWQGGSE